MSGVYIGLGYVVLIALTGSWGVLAAIGHIAIMLAAVKR